MTSFLLFHLFGLFLLLPIVRCDLYGECGPEPTSVCNMKDPGRQRTCTDDKTNYEKCKRRVEEDQRKEDKWRTDRESVFGSSINPEKEFDSCKEAIWMV
jgi:hypothetical protein